MYNANQIGISPGPVKISRDQSLRESGRIILENRKVRTYASWFNCECWSSKLVPTRLR